MLRTTHTFSRATLVAIALLLALPAKAQDPGHARLKDLLAVSGAPPLQLTGYGIVVGLDRTGDRARGLRGSPYTVQSIANMLQRFGITVDPELLATRNTAAVIVTAVLDPFSTAGRTIDATVASLGDARSLSGGVLLQTPLLEPSGRQVYAMAQGPVSTGSVLASSLGSSVKVNYTNTGRVPGGAVVTSVPAVDLSSEKLGLVLDKPDFTNAVRIVDAINDRFPGVATVVHAGLIEATAPSSDGGIAGFMAAIEGLTVAIDVPARVVINERTGTIVAGGNVHISEVMVTYGSLIVSTQQDTFVSQPGPLSGGETVVGTVGSASVDEEGSNSIVLPPNTDVNQLAVALNELGLTARDVIAIFQAIDRASALQGELIIL